MKNRIMYMTDIKKMRMDSAEAGDPKEEEVLVKVEHVGICGSDVHFFEHGRIGDFIVDKDFVLGHECAGTVVKTGKKVSNLHVGDKVALEPGVPCGVCEFCRSGKYNLCPSVKFLATPPYHGCLMDYIAYPQSMTFKLPGNVSTKEGALIEPLSVGIHAANQGNVKLGKTVTILGAGCIGLVTLLACKSLGATEIIVVDVLPNRLEKAEELGATHTIHAKEKDVVKTIQQITENAGTDVVIETAGSEQTIALSPSIAKRGGRIVLVGLAPNPIIEFNFMKIMEKEVEIKTVFRYRNIYKLAINAVTKGLINIKDIISDEFDFTESEKAFNYVIDNKDKVIKAIINL